MLNLIIALLMTLGVISTPADYHDATTEQQTEYQEIVSEDVSQI